MKRSRRILASVGIVLCCLLTVVVMLCALLRSTRVQTAMVSVVAEQLSRGLHTRVSVQEVGYAFPNQLLIRGVYVSNRLGEKSLPEYAALGDTLLYVDTLSARLDAMTLLREDRVLLRSVNLSGTRVYAHQVVRPSGDTTMNYAFLLAPRSHEKKEKQPLPLTFEVERVQLTRSSLQYNDWRVDSLFASLGLDNLDLSLPREPHLDASVRALSCVISRGLFCSRVREGKAQLVIDGQCVRLPLLELGLPTTELRITDVSFSEGNLHLSLDKAHVVPAELAVLGEHLAGMRGYYDLSATFSGRVDSLSASDVNLSFNDQRILLGSLTAMGLPARDSLYLRAEVQDLFFNRGLLQDMISSLRGRPYQLPAMLSRMGDVHYRGLLQGRVDSLRLHGAFSTALGSVSTVGNLSVRDSYTALLFTGNISTRRFRLGYLLGVPDLGTTSFSVRVDGRLRENQPFAGDVCASVDLLEYRGYAYRDVHLDGKFENRVFKGDCSSSDPNLSFLFSGEADLRRHEPNYHFAFRLNHLRLDELHLSQRYPQSDLSFSSTINLSGASTDEMTGILAIDSLEFLSGSERLPMHFFRLQLRSNEPGATAPNGVKLPSTEMLITSDYLTLTLGGDYTFSTLSTSLLRYVAEAVPHAFPAALRAKLAASPAKNTLAFSAYFHDMKEVCSVLRLPVTLTSPAILKAYMNDADRHLSFQAVVPELYLRRSHLEELTLRFGNEEGPLECDLSGYMHRGRTSAARHVGDMRFSLGLTGRGDSACFVADWKNTDECRTEGRLFMGAHFSQYAGLPLAEIEVMPTSFYLADTLWNVSHSRMTYNAADSALAVSSFSLSTPAGQFVRINGQASPRMTDTLAVDLHHFDIDYILGALTDVHNSLYFGGLVTGWAHMLALFSDPRLEAEVEMLHASINGVEMGDIYASAHLSPEHEIVLDGQVLENIGDERKEVCHATGLVAPPMWDIDLEVDSANIAFINYWTDGILTDLSGRASGHAHVGGGRLPGMKPWTYVTARAKAHRVGVTVPYTGGRYYTSDSVVMDTTSLSFRNMRFLDEEGRPLFLDGAITHNGLWLDLQYHFRAETKNAICLNLPPRPNEYYAGKVYASGVVNIDGDAQLCRIDAKARTMPGTKAIITVVDANTASSSNFVHFVDHSPTVVEEHVDSLHTLSEVLRRKGTQLNMNLAVDATPDAECQVIIDPRCGDRVKGHGAGSFRLSYSDDNGLTMLGHYAIQRGTFTFTIQNVIRREFEIAEGSSVTWSGVPENPDVSIKALYHVTASLRDLFGTDYSQISTNRSSIPVNCVLNLSDKLMNPTIRFGIELPSSDESVASQVRSVISTEDMITRQVLYLLVFNRFYTPEYLQNTQNVGLNETYSLLSSTVTGQINNWLGKVTDAFSLGFNFRTDGEGNDASQEYEAQFEIRPVRGLMINGNLGYRYNDISNQPVFGNLDVEYMLTSKGRLRAKAYTHTVDKYSLRQANTVQGVGLVFKHDFNWSDLAPHRSTQDTIPRDTLPTP